MRQIKRVTNVEHKWAFRAFWSHPSPPTPQPIIPQAASRKKVLRDTWAWNCETVSGGTEVWWFSHTWNTWENLWTGGHNLKPKLSDDFTHNRKMSHCETVSRSDDAAPSALCCNVLQITTFCFYFWPNFILNTELHLSYNTMASILFTVITTFIQFTWMEDKTAMNLKPWCDHQTCPLS